MLSVVAGELSPIMTGLMYCSVLDACRQVYALGRAREWVSAFSKVCEGEPESVAFTGACHVHRAEIMQLDGAWPDALAEACLACERSERLRRRPPGGRALSAGRDTSLAGRVRGSRRGLPRRESGRLRTAARVGAAQARPGPHRRGLRGHRTASSAPPAIGWRVRRCCPPTSRSCWLWAGREEARGACARAARDRGILRLGCAARRWPCSPKARSRSLKARRERPLGPLRAAFERWERLGSAVRIRARSRADRPRVPGAGRPGCGRLELGAAQRSSSNGSARATT